MEGKLISVIAEGSISTELMEEIKRFNLRVYAIIMKEDKILLADETINDFSFTKFPGGGVELGEGIADALKRELMEEGNIEARDLQHLYTTDFFQVSAFNPADQVVSVYYRVQADIPWEENTWDQSSKDRKHSVSLYFYPLSELKAEKLTFPIDRYVLELLANEMNSPPQADGSYSTRLVKT